MPRMLMCRPEYFEVSYKINPWMDPSRWAKHGDALAVRSHREWSRLRDCLLHCGVQIELVAPMPGLPDQVFTANAAVVLDGKALLSRFRYPQRQLEEQSFEAVFEDMQRRGVVGAVTKLPRGLVLEGAGDCVWDGVRKMFWMGYGPRSDCAAHRFVAEHFVVDVVALELADPRFYHMDTALRPLPRGDVIYVPGAFTKSGLATIRALVPSEQRIELGEDDALRLAANAVCVGRNVVLSGCSDVLRGDLAERGYHVRAVPLPSFLRSGGSAFCLTLTLDLCSGAADTSVHRSRLDDRLHRCFGVA